MKKIIFYIGLMVFLLWSWSGLGQEECSWEARLIGVDHCCADLEVRVIGSTCDFGYFNSATLSVLENSGHITSFYSASSYIDVVFGRDSVIVGSPITTPISTDFETLGTVCFENITSRELKYEVRFDDGFTSSFDDGTYYSRCVSFPSANSFQQICGSEESEIPNGIRTIGDGIYIISRKSINDQGYAAFSKYDLATGEVVFQTYIDVVSEFTDFEYDPFNDEFVVIGKTMPFQIGDEPQDNNSIVCTFDTEGNLTNQKTFNHQGREGFDQVVVHKNPVDIAYPIYVLGNKNPEPFGATMLPTRTDRTILYNFNSSLDIKWSKEYITASGTEIEVGRGIEDLSDGGLLFLGNRTIPNNGAVVKVDGEGNFLKGAFYNSHSIDFYDAYEVEGVGNIILVGTDFGNDRAIVMSIHSSTLSVRNGNQFENASNFKSIWRDVYHNYYAIARQNYSPYPNTVYKFTYSSSGFSIVSNFPKQILDGEDAYREGHIFVSDAAFEWDNIYYTDARRGNSADFGDFDLFIGTYNLEMAGNCTERTEQDYSRFRSSKEDFSCTVRSFNQPTLSPFQQQFFTNECKDYCSAPPVSLDCSYRFNYGYYCPDEYRYTFITEPRNGTPPYTYEWDLNCDGTIDGTGEGLSFSYTYFGASPFEMCWTVTDAKGASCTHIEELSPSPSDLEIYCPSNETVSTDPNTCLANYHLFVDYCPREDYYLEYEVNGEVYPENVGTVDLEAGVYEIKAIFYDLSDNLAGECVYTLTVLGNNEPIFTCLEDDQTVSTAEGQCTATVELFTPTSTCSSSSSFVYTYTLTNATQGVYTESPSFAVLNEGTTSVDILIEDTEGNIVGTCNYNIIVVDEERPVIDCPQDITVHVPACKSISDYVTVAEPIVSDNCELIAYYISHTTTDLVCGTNIITITAEDALGNISECSYNINVICDCIELVEQNITCNANEENTWEAQIVVNNLTASDIPSRCIVSTKSLDENISIQSSDYNWSGTQATIDLILTTTNADGCPIPATIPIEVNLVCECLNDSNDDLCTLTVPLMTPCCKEVAVDSSNICREEEFVIVDLIGSEDLCSIQSIRWYANDAPCPSGDLGRALQISSGYEPFTIYPSFFDADADSICVYAEVVTGGAEGGCGTLTTDIVSITLCRPITCSISPNEQEYCYTGSSIAIPLLTVSADTSLCPARVQWYDPNGNAIAGATNWTYQPPNLSFTANEEACYQDFVYRVQITSECGTQSCSAKITLYNEDAPVGELYTDPTETLPLCYGDDAIIKYDQACAKVGDDAPMWTWHISNDGTNFDPIREAGNQNPVYYTNRLYEDTWYQIHKQNGVCPEDIIELYLPINPLLSITDFTAEASPFCTPTGVALNVAYIPTPSEDCEMIIEWYKDGQIIHTQTANGTTASYNYTSIDIAGNYYVKISGCCDQVIRSPVIPVASSFDVVIAGPCFRCKGDIVFLEGLLINPSDDANYTFKWYDENGLIHGANATILQVTNNQNGPFTFEATRQMQGDICTKSTSFFLKQCGDLPLCEEEEIFVTTELEELERLQTQSSIFASAELSATSDVEFIAGDTIRLQPGFRATEGIRFRAKIGACRLENIEALDETDLIGTVLEQRSLEIEDVQLQVAPNPFANSTNIRFYLPKATEAVLTVHDLSGRILTEIQTNGEQQGWQQSTFHPEQLSEGVYYLILRTAQGTKSEKIVLLR